MHSVLLKHCTQLLLFGSHTNICAAQRASLVAVHATHVLLGPHTGRAVVQALVFPPLPCVHLTQAPVLVLQAPPLGFPVQSVSLRQAAQLPLTQAGLLPVHRLLLLLEHSTQVFDVEHAGLELVHRSRSVMVHSTHDPSLAQALLFPQLLEHAAQATPSQIGVVGVALHCDSLLHAVQLGLPVSLSQALLLQV
jgi:hypothetical protein